MDCLDNEIGGNLNAGLRRVGLTSREIQILRHLALGKADRQISIDLLISIKTVNYHVSNIILKLEATNRTHAVAKALLTKQIKMRATDAPVCMFKRRSGDRDKNRSRGASNESVIVGCQAPEHTDGSVPLRVREGQIAESELAI